MPRMISFALTTEQFIQDHANAGVEGYDPLKTHTRRLGWINVNPGDILCGVEKAQGIPKGGKVNRLGMIKVVSVRREPLDWIYQWDVVAEGFPEMKPEEFVAMFCKANKCEPSTVVTVIEFRHLSDEDQP